MASTSLRRLGVLFLCFLALLAVASDHAGAAPNPGQAGVPRGQQPYNFIYYSTGTALMNPAYSGGTFFRDHGFTGVIAIVDDALGPINLYSEDLTRAELLERVLRCRQQVGETDLWLAHNCINRAVPYSHLAPYDDDAAWAVFLRNVTWLSEAGAAVGARGILMDAENYYDFAPYRRPGGPRVAWPEHPRAAERASQYRAAVLSANAGFEHGHYTSYRLGLLTPGYVPFWQIVGGRFFYADPYTYGEEDYSRLQAEIRHTLESESVPGFRIHNIPTRWTVEQWKEYYRQKLGGALKHNHWGFWLYPTGGTNMLTRQPTVAKALAEVLLELQRSWSPPGLKR